MPTDLPSRPNSKTEDPAIGVVIAVFTAIVLVVFLLLAVVAGRGPHVSPADGPPAAAAR